MPSFTACLRLFIATSPLALLAASPAVAACSAGAGPTITCGPGHYTDMIGGFGDNLSVVLTGPVDVDLDVGDNDELLGAIRSISDVGPSNTQSVVITGPADIGITGSGYVAGIQLDDQSGDESNAGLALSAIVSGANIVVDGGLSGTGILMHGGDSISLLADADITVTGGFDAVGVNLDTASSISADISGSITIETTGSGIVAETRGDGPSSAPFSVDITNRSNITLNNIVSTGIHVASSGAVRLGNFGAVSAAGYSSKGIEIFGEGVDLVSDGDIRMEGEDSTGIFANAGDGALAAEIGGAIETMGDSSKGLDLTGGTGINLRQAGAIETWGEDSTGLAAIVNGHDTRDEYGDNIALVLGDVTTHGDSSTGISLENFNSTYAERDEDGELIDYLDRTVIGDIHLDSQGRVEVFGDASVAINLYSEVGGAAIAAVGDTIAHGENGKGIAAIARDIAITVNGTVAGGHGDFARGLELDTTGDDGSIGGGSISIVNNGVIRSGNNEAVLAYAAEALAIENHGAIRGAIFGYAGDRSASHFTNAAGGQWRIADSKDPEDDPRDAGSVIEGVINNQGVISLLDNRGGAVVHAAADELRNSGLITLVNGKADDQLNVNLYDYIGQGGTLALDANLAGAGKADFFDVVGNTSGTTTISVNNLSKGATAKSGTVIGLTAADAIAPGSFALDGGHVDSGLTRWTLQTSNETNEFGPYQEVSLVAATNTVLLAQFAGISGSIGAIDGELANVISGHAAGRATQFAVPVADLPAGRAHQLWFNGFGGDGSRKVDGLKSGLSYGGVAGGIDFAADDAVMAGDLLLFGAFGAYSAAGEDFDSLSSQTKTKSYTIGAYASWRGAGSFLDVSAPVTFTDVDYAGTGTSGKTDATSFGLHARAGHRFLAGGGWFVEPAAGIDATWSDIGDMQVGTANVAFSNGVSASGVLEGKLGHVADIEGGRLETFASAGLRESFADTGAATFDGVAIDPGSPGTVWTYGGGVAYTADEGHSGYLKASGRQGSATGFSVEGGMTMAF